MTDGPPVDDGDEIPEMIEELWDGEKSWLGKIIEVARSESPDGDVIITLPPQCFMGTATDGSRSQDVAIPVAQLFARLLPIMALVVAPFLG